jgi:hypothetical protein
MKKILLSLAFIIAAGSAQAETDAEIAQNECINREMQNILMEACGGNPNGRQTPAGFAKSKNDCLKNSISRASHVPPGRTCKYYSCHAEATADNKIAKAAYARCGAAWN